MGHYSQETIVIIWNIYKPYMALNGVRGLMEGGEHASAGGTYESANSRAINKLWLLRRHANKILAD